jgi:hypothetical protein
MNEQLQELYRQAIQSTNTDEHLDMPNKQVQRLILTKFAELLIQECVTKMALEIMDEQWVDDAVKNTYDYFGIKE